MRMDYLTIGSSPADEPCAQTGADNYAEQSRKECNAFVKQLTRQFGEPPSGARFSIKSFPHDFGTYLEVVVNYNSEEGMLFAFRVEGETPARWDAEARAELGLPAE